MAYIDDIPNLLNKTAQAKLDHTKWLFTVGIETYEYTEDIDFSKRSAKMFKKVAKKVLGVPERNCFTLLDSKATYTGIRTKLKKMLSRVKDGDTIYFYYNGHGIPNPKQCNEPYMLSSELEPEYVSEYSDLALKNIYKKLSNSKASKVIAAVDSCFSGGADGKTLLKGVAAARVAPKQVKFDTSKMVVLTAGKGTEYSNAYNEKGHRLFSYYVMKSILNGDKKLSKLYKNVYKNVKQTSSQEYGDLRVQHPTRDGNGKLRL